MLFYFRTCDPKNRSRAFTLVECLLAVSILTILALISIPSLQSWWQRQDEQLLQQTLIHTLQYAEQQAHALGVVVIVCPQGEAYQCGNDWLQGLLVFKDHYSDGVVRERGQVLTLTKLPKLTGQLRWKGYPHYQAYVRFSTDWLGGGNGAFQYYRAGESVPVWSLSLNKAGNLRSF